MKVSYLTIKDNVIIFSDNQIVLYFGEDEENGVELKDINDLEELISELNQIKKEIIKNNIL